MTPRYELIDQEDRDNRLRGFIEGRAWWIIPFIGGAASDLAVRVEGAFYSGEASADFELMLGPPFPIAFANKRRMSPEQLHAVAPELPPPQRGADVLIAAYPEEAEDVVRRALAWAGEIDRLMGESW